MEFDLSVMVYLKLTLRWLIMFDNVKLGVKVR